MNQLTLDNIETKICEKCKLGMKCESIIDDTVTYFCPACLKEYRFTVCFNCGVLFSCDGFKMCDQCREQAFNIIITGEENIDRLSPSITIKVR